MYEGHLESKERFAIQRYLLIIGKEQNMQVLSHTFTYFSTQSPWTLRHLSYRDTSLLIPSSYQTAAWLFLGSSWSLSVMNICSPVRKHCAPFSDTVRVHNMFTIDRNESLVNFTGSDVLRLQKPNQASHLHSRRELISARSLSQPIKLTTWKSLQHELHQATVHTLLNTPHDSSAKIKQLRGL